MTRALALLLVSSSACLEAPPGSSVLDASPTADAFVCTGDCCGSPLSGFSDDFEDGDPGPWFTGPTDVEGCTVAETGGAVHLSNTVEDSGCFYEIRGMLLAGGEAAAIELVEAGDGKPEAEFRLEFADGEKVAFERSVQGILVTERPVGEGSHTVKPVVSYLSGAHRFLRFVGATPGASVALETSPDGIDWAPFYLHTLAQPGSDECVQVELATFGPAGANAADEIIFDNFNRIP